MNCYCDGSGYMCRPCAMIEAEAEVMAAYYDEVDFF